MKDPGLIKSEETESIMGGRDSYFLKMAVSTEIQLSSISLVSVGLKKYLEPLMQLDSWTKEITAQQNWGSGVVGIHSFSQ